jgi:hypothetical protein
MKKLLISLTLLLSGSELACAQGTFVYDQQVTNNDFRGSYISLDIGTSQPVGQSFVPTLSSIGFVSFLLGAPSPGIPTLSPATIYVNLWAGGISNGVLLAATSPVFFPSLLPSRVITNFFFASPVALTPGTTYYLQPFIQSGNGASTIISDGPRVTPPYPGGMAFINGTANPAEDLWFREGIVTAPEPSSGLLILLGVAAIWRTDRKRILRQTVRTPLQITNVDYLLSQTNAVAGTNAPAPP